MNAAAFVEIQLDKPTRARRRDVVAERTVQMTLVKEQRGRRVLYTINDESHARGTVRFILAPEFSEWAESRLRSTARATIDVHLLADSAGGLRASFPGLEGGAIYCTRLGRVEYPMQVWLHRLSPPSLGRRIRAWADDQLAVTHGVERARPRRGS